MAPVFVVSSADGPLLLLMVLIYSSFDLSWPQMPFEEAQTLRAASKSHKEHAAG